MIRKYLNNTRVKSPEHDWFQGFNSSDFSMPEKVVSTPLVQLDKSIDLSSPILFLARGHSGTRALAELLDKSGVFMGNLKNPQSLNNSYDSLYWTFGFQRTLLPLLFKYGNGCFINQELVLNVGLECLRRHFQDFHQSNYNRWGFKTCAGMFSHPLYRYLLPNAKYVYLIRDGRDVVLSHKANFHLSATKPLIQHWEYFKIITFGISNDIKGCPFDFPKTAGDNSRTIKHKYWLQAKSWKEHIKMVEYMKESGELSPNIHLMKYEDLCTDPVPHLKKLYDFLEVEFTKKIAKTAEKLFYNRAIGRWKEYETRIDKNNQEDIVKIFEFMSPELKLFGYN